MKLDLWRRNGGPRPLPYHQQGQGTHTQKHNLKPWWKGKVKQVQHWGRGGRGICDWKQGQPPHRNVESAGTRRAPGRLRLLQQGPPGSPGTASPLSPTQTLPCFPFLRDLTTRWRSMFQPFAYSPPVTCSPTRKEALWEQTVRSPEQSLAQKYLLVLWKNLLSELQKKACVVHEHCRAIVCPSSQDIPGG